MYWNLNQQVLEANMLWKKESEIQHGLNNQTATKMVNRKVLIFYGGGTVADEDLM